MATIQRSYTKVANKLISYAEKRSEVTNGVNCPPEYAKSQFKATRELWGKNDGIQAHHVIQSFSPGEVTAKKANEIGQQLAQKIADGHEAVVYTHTDKDHIHNHIVINSVNFENGYKYHAHGSDELYKIREASDEICKENELSVIKINKEKSVHLSNAQYRAMEKGISRQGMLINSIKHARGIATSKDDYINEMQQLGYDVQWSDKRKRITYIDKEYQQLNDERKLEGKKGVRFKFSEKGLMKYGLSKHELSKEGLEHEFRENARPEQTTRVAESNQEREYTDLSNINDDQAGRSVGIDDQIEGNRGVSVNISEGEHEQRDSNNKRTGKDQRNESTSSRTDEIDFAKIDQQLAERKRGLHEAHRQKHADSSEYDTKFRTGINEKQNLDREGIERNQRRQPNEPKRIEHDEPELS